MTTLSATQHALLSRIQSAVDAVGTDAQGYITHEAVLAHCPDTCMPTLPTLKPMVQHGLLSARRVVRQPHGKPLRRWSATGGAHDRITYSYNLKTPGTLEGWLDAPLPRLAHEREEPGATPEETFYIYPLSLKRGRSNIIMRPSVTLR